MASNNHKQLMGADVVDFAVVANNHYNNNSTDTDNNLKQNQIENVPKTSKNLQQIPNQNRNQVPNKATTNTTTNNMTTTNKYKKQESVTDNKNNTETQKKHTTKERLSLFSFSKKISQKTAQKAPTEKSTTSTSSSTFAFSYQQPQVPIGTPPRQHKFVKSSSIARLLGNTYNAKKFEKAEQKRLSNESKFNTFGGRKRSNGPYLERFKQYAKEDGDAAETENAAAEIILTNALSAGDRCVSQSGLDYYRGEQSQDLGLKAFRSLSRGLGKLWWRRTHSVDISTPDPEFKVSYLGNVLTGWAKGEGCVEKQLNTLWRNYTQNNKPDVIMRIKVSASGLKATTRQHGLTEYWANRITHCCAPKNYPRVFCWIYRHEGRKLKHELRCHAVLCSKEKIVQDICETLKENLDRALRDFKREKILKQNARLSLANAAYDNPSLPRRKILLSVGGNNYRPPLERSKSAPKLMAIEEAIGEEEGDEIEETNEPEMRACCQKDSLYPAMTLGRRRCRRGHSIRRTGIARTYFSAAYEKKAAMEAHRHIDSCCSVPSKGTSTKEKSVAAAQTTGEETRNSYGSDDSDDFEKLLKYNDYDSSATLTNELLPYFDMQLHKNTSCSLGSLSDLKDDEEPLSLLPTINSDPSADPEADYNPNDSENIQLHNDVMALRRSGVCSDGEEDYMDADDMYFRQASILTMLQRDSMHKLAHLSLSSDEGSSIETNASAPIQYSHQMQSSISSDASSTATSASATLEAGHSTTATSTNVQQRKQLNMDSDEGSISSGCETASTVTANQDDVSLQYRQRSKQLDGHLAQEGELELEHEHEQLAEEPITAEEIYQRLESRLQGRNNSDATTFSSSSSITLKLSSGGVGGGAPSPTGSVSEIELSSSNSSARTRRMRRQPAQRGDSDSECSDESGYVEYQERDKKSIGNGNAPMANNKPQPPPKPMPRRLASSANAATAV